MERLHSYPQIFNLGHRAVQDILKGPVVVQEKIDGSQFSFKVIPLGEVTDELVMKSKSARVMPETADKLFKPAVDTVMQLWQDERLVPGWTYRGEVLAKPKHNTLAYDRVPRGNIILFDIDRGEEDYTPVTQDSVITDLYTEASSLGLEAVPTFFSGMVTSLDQVHGFLDRVSVLGGSKIEGVVIKAYGTYGEDKKTLMAKYVSEAFKEVHQGDWRTRNPGRQDVVLRLIEMYCTPARWQKAVQHLRERGELQEAPQDIGPLMKEVGLDILKEEKEAIADALFAWAWPQIQRGVTKGLPQWYKDELAKAAFVPTSVADLADPRPVLKDLAGADIVANDRLAQAIIGVDLASGPDRSVTA